MFYENAVIDYLKADRAVFVNPGCLVCLDESSPEAPGRHWYCDALAIDFRSQQIFLCEVSYAKNLDALIGRLAAWSINWEGVCKAIRRDCKLEALPNNWMMRPWIFVPKERLEILIGRLSRLPNRQYVPRITTLEMVQPWKYNNWVRIGEEQKPDCIPSDMCA